MLFASRVAGGEGRSVTLVYRALSGVVGLYGGTGGGVKWYAERFLVH